ncbi:MAG: ABC transporter ATP-binding protein [Candidatus Korobacteraceae bacterium]
MSSGQTIIRLQNVTQRFRVIHERPDTLRELFSKMFRHQSSFHDFEAVKNASFEVPRGQALGIIGRNGSGKSTLLKIIAGVYQPTSGKVEVEGSLAPLIELGAGFHHELTGRENILLNGLLMGYSRREMMKREAGIIEFAEIGDFIDAPVKQYSSGMYMRLAFAVAIEVDPQILVVDEILAVGDMGFQEKCFERIRRFREAGKTILLVTHDMGDVQRHCERTLLLDHGTIVFDGAPAEAVEMYKSLLVPEVVAAH